VLSGDIVGYSLAFARPRGPRAVFCGRTVGEVVACQRPP
jgi:hypothetical protein